LIFSWGPDLQLRHIREARRKYEGASIGLLAVRQAAAVAPEGSAAQFIEHSTLCCEAAAHGDGHYVTSGTIWNLLPLLFGLFGAQPGAVGQSVTRLVVQEEVILRVPIQPQPLIPEFDWVEKKGPKCVPVAAIRRALLSGSEQVDFILVSRERVRAQFDENCTGLDFYRGFYLQPQDERLCAHRDAVYSRIGGSCTIERFKQLVPKFRR